MPFQRLETGLFLVNIVGKAASILLEVMVLDLRKMRSVGISKLQAIGAGLERFKSSGKQIFAVGDYYNQHQYYLVAHADKLYLSPMGGVILHGFGLYRKYYKTALDKLQIQFHVFKVGTYKSALEPFLRDSMSNYAKEANLAWLNTLWDFYKTYVAEQRGLYQEYTEPPGKSRRGSGGYGIEPWSGR